jgi:hypothetical protein
MASLTKDEAEAFIKEHGSLAFLIETGLFVPAAEPEKPAEVAPWDLFKDRFCSIGGYSRDEAIRGNAVHDIKLALEATGLKLVKQADELVVVHDHTRDELLDAMIEATVFEGRRTGERFKEEYVIAKRAGV